jgi:YbbR domain-containing protein
MTKNLGLKAFSVLLALVMAYAVNSESNAGVVTVVVPLEFQGLPVDRVVTRPAKKSVQVTLKGPSFMIGSVASSPPSIKIKLPNQVEDRLPVSYKASDMHLPPGVDVLAFDPSEAEVVLESLESKEVRVEVPRLGQLPLGFTLDGIQISPKTIVVRGPRTEVRQLKSIETDPVDLREFEDSRKIELRIRLPGGQTHASTEKVSALVEVSQLPSERIFKGRPVELRGLPGLSGVKLIPTEVSVVISAPSDIVEKLEASEIIPFVRVKEKLSAITTEVSVDVEAPSNCKNNCKIVRVEPSKITISSDAIKPIVGKVKSARSK